MLVVYIYIYILSVYSPFSTRVGLPLHNTPFPWVLMKSIGAAFFRPDALPDVNHMRGMQVSTKKTMYKSKSFKYNCIIDNHCYSDHGIMVQWYVYTCCVHCVSCIPQKFLMFAFFLQFQHC